MTAIALFPLTTKQEAVLAFMWEFYQVNDMLPSGGEVARNFGFSTRKGAADHMQAIERKGYIERNTIGAYRFTPLFHAEQKAAEKADD